MISKPVGVRIAAGEIQPSYIVGVNGINELSDSRLASSILQKFYNVMNTQCSDIHSAIM